MPYPQETISSFRANYPRTFSFLYQLFLLFITFECAITIARYGPEMDDPATLASRTSLLSRGWDPPQNATVERICKYGAREDFVDLGYLAIVTPHFILCPTTPTCLSALIVYIWGILNFNTLHKDDIMNDLSTWFMAFWMTAISINWRHIFASIQIFLPINIWGMGLISAIIHAMWRGCFPRSYARVKDICEKIEEARRKKAVSLHVEGAGDLEGGSVVGGTVAVLQEGVSEGTPLTEVGASFAGARTGVYVEIPGPVHVEIPGSDG